MGYRIMEDNLGGMACFYDSVTMTPFAPIADSKEELEAFREWLGEDPRGVSDILEKWVEFQDAGKKYEYKTFTFETGKNEKK